MALKPNSAAYDLSLDDTLQELLGTRTSRAVEIEDICDVSTLPEEVASLSASEINSLDDSIEIELSAEEVMSMLVED
jgi:hypothetical protein